MKLLKILSIMLLASSLLMSYFMAAVIVSIVLWEYLLQLVMFF